MLTTPIFLLNFFLRIFPLPEHPPVWLGLPDDEAAVPASADQAPPPEADTGDRVTVALQQPHPLLRDQLHVL